MQRKSQLLGNIVWFASVNDADLLEEDRILTADFCLREDRATVREAARVVDALLKDFSYVQSPEFAAQVEGKSDAFVTMRTRLADEPAKRPPQRRRAEEALAQLLSSDLAYKLFAADSHPQLDCLRTTFTSLANPD